MNKRLIHEKTWIELEVAYYAGSVTGQKVRVKLENFMDAC